MCSVQHIVFKWHTPRVCSERNVSQNMRKFSLVFCNLFRSYFAIFFARISHFFAKFFTYSQKWMKQKMRKQYMLKLYFVFYDDFLQKCWLFIFNSEIVRKVFAFFFREIFALFFCEIFYFFCIFSRTRLKRNFEKKAKIVGEIIFSFSLQTLHTPVFGNLTNYKYITKAYF